ncbi:MAG TPA: HAD-IIA family hydrolase [Verrucomicrobiae bacterium]|nr:HAD-IIA family hydrolase [Verrucomicrobiae bacterium]
MNNSVRSRNPNSKTQLGDRLRKIRHVALDMDGTIYLNNTVFDTTAPFLTLLSKMGVGHTFLTNNPSKSISEYIGHLKSMGIQAKAGQLYTSIQATIDFLKKDFPQIRRLFVLGTTGLCDELKSAGFELMADDSNAPPDAVIVGFDKTLTYSRMCRAAWWIKQGKPYFATNPDLVCPTDEPTVLIDCGSITAALEKATSRPPQAVLGKPDPAMLRGILQRHSLKPENLAMVGDRLYTDMAMARRAGAVGVLVLTGEATAAEAETYNPKPDLIVPTLREFGELLESSGA